MIEKVLEERKTRYGTFRDNAEIAQKIKSVLYDHPNWDKMPYDNRQALCVICDKMARMMTGDPDYDDSWVDIIGYATLVLNRIRDDQREEKHKFDIVDPEKIREYLDKGLHKGGTIDNTE